MSIKDRSPEFALLPSQVAGIVPSGSKDNGKWNVKEHITPSVSCLRSWLHDVLILVEDERRMARFAQYAMVASEEALKDAGWHPNKEEDLEDTVHVPVP